MEQTRRPGIMRRNCSSICITCLKTGKCGADLNYKFKLTSYLIAIYKHELLYPYRAKVTINFDCKFLIKALWLKIYFT